jgi:hypothetical protein
MEICAIARLFPHATRGPDCQHGFARAGRGCRLVSPVCLGPSPVELRPGPPLDRAAHHGPASHEASPGTAGTGAPDRGAGWAGRMPRALPCGTPPARGRARPPALLRHTHRSPTCGCCEGSGGGACPCYRPIASMAPPGPGASPDPTSAGALWRGTGGRGVAGAAVPQAAPPLAGTLVAPTPPPPAFDPVSYPRQGGASHPRLRICSRRPIHGAGAVLFACTFSGHAGA